MNSVNVGLAGHFELAEGATAKLTPLLTSSVESALTPSDRFQFLPDPEDWPEYRRTGAVPLSLESGRPLADFDFVGFSLTYEGDYIHTLRLLRMAGITPAGKMHLRDGRSG